MHSYHPKGVTVHKTGQLHQPRGAARLLLEAGANPHARNENDSTPLGSATNLAPEVAEVSVKAGARVDQPSDADGRTRRWYAACRGNLGVVTLLRLAGELQ